MTLPFTVVAVIYVVPALLRLRVTGCGLHRCTFAVCPNTIYLLPFAFPVTHTAVTPRVCYVYVAVVDWTPHVGLLFSFWIRATFVHTVYRILRFAVGLPRYGCCATFPDCGCVLFSPNVSPHGWLIVTDCRPGCCYGCRLRRYTPVYVVSTHVLPVPVVPVTTLRLFAL